VWAVRTRGVSDGTTFEIGRAEGTRTFRQNVPPLILKRWLCVVSVMFLTSTTIH
jgi:hypothetical protein